MSIRPFAPGESTGLHAKPAQSKLQGGFFNLQAIQFAGTGSRADSFSAMADRVASNETIAPAQSLKALNLPDSPVPSMRLLVPQGTPVLLMHGTSSTGANMGALVHWMRNRVQADYPAYVAYLPEIEQASGIENVLDTVNTVPSYQLAYREIGSFRAQLVQQKLKALNDKHIRVDSDNTAIQEAFQLKPADTDWLAPIVRIHLLGPLQTVPSGWHPAYAESLATLSRTMCEKLQTEVAKLQVRADEKDRAIIDTQFLASKAGYEGKTLNFDMRQVFKDVDIVNIRPVTLAETALLEGYLQAIQTSLATAIRKHLAAQSTNSQPSDSTLDIRAVKTAERLMEKVAPRLITLGHSQGGTVIRMAHINYALSRPPASFDIRTLDPRPYIGLPSRSVGMEVPLSSPLGGGIPSIPVWGQKLLIPINALEKQIPFLSGYPGAIGRWLEDTIWAHKGYNKPAISEMRQNSPLVQKIRHCMATQEDEHLTILNVMAADDAYVEPHASALEDAQGKLASNVFNLKIHTDERVPAIMTDQDEVIAEFTHLLPPVGRYLAHWLPERWKQKIHQFYQTELNGMEQHRAVLTFPDAVNREVGYNLLSTPENRSRLLQTRQFEPLRMQSMAILNSPLSALFTKPVTPSKAFARLQAIDAQLCRQPQLIHCLIQNAAEDLPLLDSASETAQQFLAQFLQSCQQTIQIGGSHLKPKACQNEPLAALLPQIASGLKAIQSSFSGSVAPPLQKLATNAETLLVKNFSAQTSFQKSRNDTTDLNTVDLPF